jgi:hypothetical protein
MNKNMTVVIVSLSMLMSLSVSAAGRPSVGANAKRITTLEGQVSQLESDLVNIALTPGPQGDKGEAGRVGDAGQAGAKGDTGQAGSDGQDGVMYDGAFEGDMQYWNGNVWLMITAPAEDADSLSFCDGVPTWTQGTCPVEETPPTVNMDHFGLGSAKSFGVLAGTTIVNNGQSFVEGDIGVYPGTAIAGTAFDGNGTQHSADIVAMDAQNDLWFAYNYNKAIGDGVNLSGNTLDSKSFTKGKYKLLTTAYINGGVLTLDAEGDPDAIWIFDAGTTIYIASGSRIVLKNGAKAANVLFIAGTSITVADGSELNGNFIARTAITVESSNINGSIFAQTAVTISNSNVGLK